MGNFYEQNISFRIKQKLFCGIRNVNELANLLGTNANFLEKLASRPPYDEFDLPKKNGGIRHIEDPDDELKDILRAVNDYLQVIYYNIRSDAAFGFMIVPVFDKSPRNIKNNALRHQNNEWMLNADFRDFFHQIKYQEVQDIFSCPPFNFNYEVATLLAQLTTYKGRLPMGSPTSPVLSNFATRQLDSDLSNLATKNRWIYTRFADDLTFSSHEAIGMEHFETVKYTCDLYGYEFNPDKIKFLMPNDLKIVTGLVVTNRVDIPNDFIESLKSEIGKLAITLEVNFRTGKQPTKWLKNYQQQIEGAIEFVRQIETARSPDYIALKKMYKDAKASSDVYGPVSWMDFGYLGFM